jgi:hypothetical protein
MHNNAYASVVGFNEESYGRRPAPWLLVLRWQVWHMPTTFPSV